MNTFKKTITALASVALFAAPLMVGAQEMTVTAAPVLYSEPVVQHYTADTVLTVGNADVKIKAGSAYSSLEVTDGKMYVTVPEGEAFEIRQATPLPIENNLGEAGCRIIKTRENRLVINGPKEAIVFVGSQACSTGNYNTDTTPVVTVSSPALGEALSDGQDKQIFWTSDGDILASIRLRLSLDGGETYPITIADQLFNNGFYNWQVPLVETTDEARIIIEGYNQGVIKTFSVTEPFRIEGTEPAPEEPEITVEPYDYDPEVEMTESNSVDIGAGYVASTGGLSMGSCTPGIRLKLADSPTVYYCGVDGKRHSFPNRKVHDSWFEGFAGVVTFTPGEMANVQLGANVTYRPGFRLVKLTTDAKVYVVATGGVLRWVETEATAERLYGADWNKKIDDVPDAFFADYTLGDSIK